MTIYSNNMKVLKAKSLIKELVLISPASLCLWTQTWEKGSVGDTRQSKPDIQKILTGNSRTEDSRNSLLHIPCGFSSFLLIIVFKASPETGDYSEGRLNQIPHTRLVGRLARVSLLYSFSAEEMLLNLGKTFISSSMQSTSLKILQLKTDNEPSAGTASDTSFKKLNNRNEHFAKKTISYIEILKSHFDRKKA